MRLTLNRHSYHHAFGVLGTLSNATSGLLAMTLEPPWRDNKPNESAIMPGLYKLAPHSSEKFGQTFSVVNVPGRSGIIFHSGNDVADTRGCILLGLKASVYFQLLDSRQAMSRFRAAVSNETELWLDVG